MAKPDIYDGSLEAIRERDRTYRGHRISNASRAAHDRRMLVGYLSKIEHDFQLEKRAHEATWQQKKQYIEGLHRILSCETRKGVTVAEVVELAKAALRGAP